DFREKIPITRPFNQFPLMVEQWSGTRQTLPLEIVSTLDLSDYVVVDYSNPAGKVVNLYVAYYESQKKGESIHSPATCLPGRGWIFKEAGTTIIPTPGYNGGQTLVNRAYMQMLDNYQLSYFWFPQRGRILTSPYQLKLFAFWDALIRQRTDGALVRVITPVYETEGQDDAEMRLQEFTRQILPVLAEYLPGDS
ncbi:MAG: exosortase C-terminal domain/associated protein EpsI, partial [Thermodesulfobacteriota bacterium]